MTMIVTATTIMIKSNHDDTDKTSTNPNINDYKDSHNTGKHIYMQDATRTRND